MLILYYGMCCTRIGPFVDDIAHGETALLQHSSESDQTDHSIAETLIKIFLYYFSFLYIYFCTWVEAFQCAVYSVYVDIDKKPYKKYAAGPWGQCVCQLFCLFVF